MSAAMGPPPAQQMTVSNGVLRAQFGPGTVTEIAELFRALAVTCVQKQYRRVLIVADDDDPAGESALRDALTVMVLAGIPSDFKLALVAHTDRVEFTYRNAQRDLCAAGVMTRVFDREDEARLWLDSTNVSTSSAGARAKR